MSKQISGLLLIVVSLCANTLAHATPIASAGGPYYVTSTNRTVNFSGTGTPSSGQTVDLYEWDFENDGVYDWSSTTTGNTAHIYAYAVLSSPGTSINALFRVTESGFGETPTDDDLATIYYANTAPFITSTPVVTGVSGVQYIYDVEASDIDLPYGDLLSFHLDTAPAGMSINVGDGLINWMPTTAGSYDVRVRVDDSFGATAAQRYTLVVGDIPNVPEPATLVLMGLGLVGIGYKRYKKAA